MNNTSTFSIRRLTLLMGRDVYTNLKYYLTFFATLSGILITLSLLNTWSSNGVYDTNFLLNQGQFMLFLFGLVITSTTFKELHSNNRGWFYLMLPANPLEKILSHWLITSIGYAVVATLVFVLASIITSTFAWLLFRSEFFIFNPFTPNFLKNLLHYCIAQSLFLFGAIYFKRNSLIKTLLSIIGVIFFLIVIIIAAIHIIDPDLAYFNTLINLRPDQQTLIPNYEKIDLLNVLYYTLFAPFFLTLTYFRFIEKEV